jgi:hypothetical protein
VKGIQVCSNKEPGPLQTGNYHKNVRMGWDHLKIFFSTTTGPILTRLGTNHPWVERIPVCSNEGDSPSSPELADQIHLNLVQKRARSSSKGR